MKMEYVTINEEALLFSFGFGFGGWTCLVNDVIPFKNVVSIRCLVHLLRR
jgi:hypothetical protein